MEFLEIVYAIAGFIGGMGGTYLKMRITINNIKKSVIIKIDDNATMRGNIAGDDIRKTTIIGTGNITGVQNINSTINNQTNIDKKVNISNDKRKIDIESLMLTKKEFERSLKKPWKL